MTASAVSLINLLGFITGLVLYVMLIRLKKLLAAVTAIFVLATMTAFAQQPETGLPRHLSVDVDVVLVNATVTDSQGHYVAKLEREGFRLWEDRIEQKIEYFASEDIPQTVGILFDVSASMQNKFAVAQEAAMKFLQMGNRDDEFFLIEFNDRAELTRDFTANFARLEKQLVTASPDGNTALYDAIYLGLQKVRAGHNPRKALLLITDGVDNWSSYSLSEVKEFLKESDTQLYAIGIESWDSHHYMKPEEEQDPRIARIVLNELSDISGGRAFFTTSVSDLNGICTRIALELQSEYVFGYISSNTKKDGKWRKITLKLEPAKNSPHLHIRAKRGYYAPRQ
jgi:Ca-activated chloride channel family protein